MAMFKAMFLPYSNAKTEIVFIFSTGMYFKSQGRETSHEKDSLIKKQPTSFKLAVFANFPRHGESARDIRRPLN